MILLVGLGGGLGSILRFLTSVIVNKYTQTTYPLSTFTVNIIGCFIIGMLLGLFERNQIINTDLRLLFMTGFCGGYTTFSAFALENINLFQSGHTLTALLYIVASVILGLLAVWGGVLLIK
ncbi:fluoride efflux transporter CrcB [Bacteroides sp. 214]|uniref:fluoride efflux transporter CrcB n=1 Tax=Bacteroides sp. 214 TaxID=2302935 RepID=UPI001EF22FA1|nr:fluoride efflux transporter CrcB [Bacteroides sp. 214]